MTIKMKETWGNPWREVRNDQKEEGKVNKDLIERPRRKNSILIRDVLKKKENPIFIGSWSNKSSDIQEKKNDRN